MGRTLVNSGLLGPLNRPGAVSGGLLGALSAPRPQADAIDEMMMRRQAEREAAAQAQTAPAQAAPQGLLSPQRPRVSGLRIFDQVLGGKTISDAYDSERARLEAEAMRPQLLQRQEQLRQIAEGMGPAALVAYATNPEKFGENLAETYGVTNTPAGGISSVFATGQQIGAPTYTHVNDQIFRNDPVSGQSTVSATAAPSFADQTNRYKAENDAALSQDRLALDQQTGLGSLGVQQDRLAMEQAKLQAEQGATQQANAAQTEAANQTAQNMAGALARARQFTRAAGVWSGKFPWMAQDRANLEGNLDTLRGNLTFDKLMEMKRNSPTGASGLGALSDNEARLLSSTAAALNADMSPQELERSFQVIDQLLAKTRQPSAGAGVARPTSQAEFEALPSGTVFIAPDGSTRRKP